MVYSVTQYLILQLMSVRMPQSLREGPHILLLFIDHNLCVGSFVSSPVLCVRTVYKGGPWSAPSVPPHTKEQILVVQLG